MKARKFRNRDGSVAYKVTVSVRPFKRVTRSFPTAAAAKEWHDRHRQELKQHRRAVQDADLTRLTIAGLVERFLADPETRSLAYVGDLERLLAWWVNQYGSTRVLRTGALLWREGRGKLLSERLAKTPEHRTASTVNRYLSAMRSCWNWGRAAELIPTNMTWPSRLMLKEPKGRTRYLTDEELESLQSAAADSPMMNAAVLISIGCGVRQSELLRLRWADVDLAKLRLRVLLSKNNESRSVYLPAAAAAALRQIKRGSVIGSTVIADEDGQPADKSWLMYRWRLLRKAAGLDNFRWHDLRHSCASFLAQEGANLLEIGAVLGHTSPSVTKRYAHLIEGSPVTGHTKLDEKLSRARKP